MYNRIFYYARVSSSSQHLSRQIKKFKDIGADSASIIVDKESGKDINREGYLNLKNNLLRPGDTLYVTSLDRLSRCKADIINELRYFHDNQIRVKILDIPTSLIEVPEEQEWIMEMVQNILIEVLASVAQREREMIHQRQAEGIEAAKLRHVRFGRPPYVVPDNYEAVMKRVESGELRPVEAMKIMNMKKSTYYKLRRNEQ